MPTMDLFRQLGSIFPPEDLAWVIAALRQDPLVWTALEQEAFLPLALERLSNQAARWNPGDLALLALSEPLALGEPYKAEELQSEPLIPLCQDLQEKAIGAYQNVQRTGTPPANLREAGLIALALRERRRLASSWTGVLADIFVRPGGGEGVYNTWRTPLACLAGLVPDPEEMLRSLVSRKSPRDTVGLIIHAILSQPSGTAGYRKGFEKHLEGLPVSYQLNLLRALSLRGQEALAADLAAQLVIGHPAFASLRIPPDLDDMDLAAVASRALGLQQMSAFYQLAGEFSQAKDLLSAADMTLEQWQAGLCLQRMNFPAGEDFLSNSVLPAQKVDRLAAAGSWLKNELGAALVSYPYASSLIEQAQDLPESPYLQLKQAAILFEREPALARDLARQGAAGLLAKTRQGNLPFPGAFLTAWQPQDGPQILLKVGLPEEALQMAQALLQIRPNDMHLLSLASRISDTLDRPVDAIQAAENRVALDPLDAGSQRWLAGLWWKAGEWEKAYEQWRIVLSLADPLLVEDRLFCAQAAIKAGKMDNALSMIEKLLEEEPNNGAALSLLGQALAARGDIEQAVNHLVRAALLAPDLLDNWMTLASAQQALGEAQRAMETLRAAAVAIPEAVEPPLALGRICLERELPSEGLPYLRKAFQLDPDLDQAALLYARALRLLGHTSEARTILERWRGTWSMKPELAYEYALLLLDQNDAENALPVLELALRSGLPVVDAYLLYVKILMGDYRGESEDWNAEISEKRLQQAEQTLRRIVELDAGNCEASFLMADLMREKGSLDSALEMYSVLSEAQGDVEPDLAWRIKWGLGRTALRLGQIDTALVALKEARQLRPDYLPLQRTLAEASHRANLPNEAREAADSTLQLAPGNLENLVWYAGFAVGLGESRKALDALKQAIQIDPGSADLRARLAELQVSAGMLDSARESLEELANLETVDSEDLRRAAHIYLRLENHQSALACYERALRLAGESASVDLLYETAKLYERLGNFEAALDTAQNAAQKTAATQNAQGGALQNLAVVLLQADLLARLNRAQAALALLEGALRFVEGDPTRVKDLAEIYERFTCLMLLEGNLPAALHHAEKALDVQPGSASLCYRAADLAAALLQNERAARLIRSLLSAAASPSALMDQGKAGLDLYCMQIELDLESGNIDEARAWIEAGLVRAGQYSRMQAAKARLLARQGKIQEARKLYELARNGQRESAQSIEPLLWLAEAARDARVWREALPAFDRYVQANPAEARGYLAQARALVLAAEAQGICSLLYCRAIAPGVDIIREANHKKFAEAIQEAGRLSNNGGDIARWQARGEAAFAPTAFNARTLAALPAGPGDTAALVGVLRSLNNIGAAIQVARRHADSPEVLLQLVLCYSKEPGNEGLTVARRAVEANPDDPLAYVAHALVAGRSLGAAAALESYQKAISLEPGEPDWQDAAGDLCVQVEQWQQALLYRQRALELDPNNARFAYKLGQFYLLQENPADAVRYLERSVALAPQQADAWLALGGAYHAAGWLPQALDAARRAADLNPSSAESLLLAGETALLMEQPDLAMQYARGAARLEPENPTAVLFLSSILSLTGQVDESLAVIENASQAVRQVFPVAFERAKLIYQQHGPRAALDILEKLVREHSEEPGLLTFLARVQAECGETKSAERYAFKSLRLDPNQPDLTLMLGRLERKTGQLDQAVFLLSEAIRMAPDKLENYLELGSVYRERNEYALALQVYRQAMEIAPENYEPYYHSGLIMRDSKDYAGAETMLRKAADLASDNTSIRRQLVGVIALNLVHQSKQEVTIP